MKQILSIFIALTFLSACRTSRSVSELKESSVSTETSQSSEVSSTSFADFMREYNLEADSMTIWIGTRPSMHGDASLVSSDSVSECEGMGKSSVLAKPVPDDGVTKIKICGLRVKGTEAASNLRKEEKAIKADSSYHSDFQKREEEEVRSSYFPLFYYVMTFIAVALIVVMIVFRKKLMNL